MKLDTILCPVDFSDPSRHAFDYAKAIAEWYAARVVALHVAEPAPAMAVMAGALTAETAGTDLSEIRRRIRHELKIGLDAAVTITPDAASGLPADAIVAYADAARPDLMVIGTRGAGGLKHLVLGSVTEDVIRASPCPVLAIPPRAGSLVRFPFRRVLCVTDFSAPSIAALRVAVSMTDDAVAQVIVLHVVDSTDENDLFVARPYDVHRHKDARDAHARQSLQDVAAVPFAGRRAPELRVAHGRADEEILRCARETEAELVVMGVQGKNGLTTMLFGSTTNSVVRQAACPVLIAHV
jgi:nucleotide-binding universal stress UspA family protein